MLRFFNRKSNALTEMIGYAAVRSAIPANGFNVGGMIVFEGIRYGLVKASRR